MLIFLKKCSSFRPPTGNGMELEKIRKPKTVYEALDVLGDLLDERNKPAMVYIVKADDDRVKDIYNESWGIDFHLIPLIPQ